MDVDTFASSRYSHLTEILPLEWKIELFDVLGNGQGKW